MAILFILIVLFVFLLKDIASNITKRINNQKQEEENNQRGEEVANLNSLDSLAEFIEKYEDEEE